MKIKTNEKHQVIWQSINDELDGIYVQSVPEPETYDMLATLYYENGSFRYEYQPLPPIPEIQEPVYEYKPSYEQVFVQKLRERYSENEEQAIKSNYLSIPLITDELLKRKYEQEFVDFTNYRIEIKNELKDGDYTRNN